ncbi:MAG TPA: hypothetical protein VF692_06290 [Pyrinomonadaceae bacterium]
MEILLDIRQEMARQADYDVDLFAEMVRAGKFSKDNNRYDLAPDNPDRKTKNQVKKQTGTK